MRRRRQMSEPRSLQGTVCQCHEWRPFPTLAPVLSHFAFYWQVIEGASDRHDLNYWMKGQSPMVWRMLSENFVFLGFFPILNGTKLHSYSS